MPSIKNIVDNPHPVYSRNIDYWNFLLDSFEGGIDYTNVDVSKTTTRLSVGSIIKVEGRELKNKFRNNLFQYPKEREEDYERRLQRSYYYNFCSPIIDIYTNHLFKDCVNEDFGSIDSVVNLQKENIDRQDSNITEFRKSMCELSQIYGHVFVLVDSPMAQGEISMQDKIDNNSFPYLTLVHPQNVINWAVDKFGKPYWVLIAETIDVSSDPSMFDKDRRNITTYRLWERNQWSWYGEDFEFLMSAKHNVGEVPIVPVYDKQSKKQKSFLGVSFIADISFIAKDVYNLCSELTQILVDQTFAFLALQGKSSDYSDMVLGVGKGLTYPEGNNIPQYVAPPPANAEILMKQIEGQISRMFQLAKLIGGSASFKGQSAVEQSGVSKAWDFNETNSALSKKSSNMEDAEIKIWDIFAKWEGKNWDGSINYPKEFNVKDLIQDLEEAERMMKLNLGQTFKTMVKKSIVKKKFPRLSDEDEKEIFDQIDSAIDSTTNGRFQGRLSGFLNNANQGGNGGNLNARGNENRDNVDTNTRSEARA